MKIGILTYHFATNYGALLQCFALQTSIEKLGKDVVVIDYRSKIQKDNNALFSRRLLAFNIVKNIMLLPYTSFRKRRFHLFDSFVKEMLALTNEVNTIKDLKEIVDNLDIVIVGSDQVWNPNVKDFDRAFFLPFDSNAKKTTFAASFGNASSFELKDFLAYMKDFEYITIREKGGETILNQIGIKCDDFVMDPVFLLDKQQWISISAKYTKINDNVPFLLCYFLKQENNKKYFKYARRIAAKKNIELVNIVTRYRPSSMIKKSLLDVGPREFLYLISRASYICTDSFHGTAFASIFNVDFTSFCDSKENDTRKKNLLEALGLADRLYVLDEGRLEDSAIDFFDVNKHLFKTRQNQIKTLKRICMIND